MSRRYLCPKHEESTPSAVVYGNGYHCFGCGARGPISDLGLPAGERVEITYIEDIQASLSRIKSLPKKVIRGFSFHADDHGYYIVWPDDSYYKRRLFVDGEPKYRGPAGHRKPPFPADVRGRSHLVLIEGELNALSLAMAELPLDIISPGGAGDFYSKHSADSYPAWASYPRVSVVVDADAPGAQAAIEAKSRLVTLGCQAVDLHLMSRDFNEILSKDGLRGVLSEAIRMKLSME